MQHKQHVQILESFFFLEQGSRVIILLYNNTIPHKANVMRQIFKELIWKVLLNAVYSTEFPLSDNHLLLFLLHFLPGQKLQQIQDIEKSSEEFIESKPESFFYFEKHNFI